MEKKRHSHSEKKKAPFIFYVILGAIPVLFFIILEFGLVVGGYGYDYNLFTKKEWAAPGMVYINPNITYKYFGKLKSPVYSSEVGIYESKPKNGIRVFVLGGSSAQGFPYNSRASFPGHLQRHLDYLYPENTVEVVNLGASAVNTYTLNDLLPQVLNESPDLILIYAGHNEYYGALGAGSSQSIKPALVRTLLYLREYRTVQLIENSIAAILNRKGSSDKNLMQQMIGESSIPFDSDIYRTGIEQYQENLSLMLAKIVEAEVPVLVGTLTSNIRDHKPFDSSQGGRSNMSADDFYLLAKSQLSTRDSTVAKSNFILAKEYDELRFRAPEQMNSIITKTTAQYEVPIVDLETIFSKNSTGQITGNELMCDHLHPNLAGYYLMSKSFAQAIIDNNLLPKPNATPGQIEVDLDSLLLTNFPYTSFDTLIDNHILLSGIGSYPFVPVGAPNPYQAILDNDGINFNSNSSNEIDSVRAIIAANYLRNEDSISFQKEMSVFLSYFPNSEIRYLKSINRLNQERVLQKAYPLIYENLVKMKDSRPKSKAIGLYHKYLGNYDSALYYLESLKKLNQNDTLLMLDIGFVYLEKEDYEKALEEFSAVITLAPHNQEAYHQRAITRFELKDYSGTIEDIDKSMELLETPDTLSLLIRGYAHIGNKDQDAACEDWRKSAELGSKQATMLYGTYCNR